MIKRRFLFGDLGFVRVLVAGALLCAALGCAGADYDVVLTGGRVMDPASGLDAVRNVGILDGRIEAISEEELSGRTTVDVSGHVVAPGFIDLHAHGQRPQDMVLQVQDGVTTALDLEIGAHPVDAFYAGLEGRAPIHHGASVSHIGARVDVFHAKSVVHWPTNPDVVADLGLEPAGTMQEADDSQLKSLEILMHRGLDAGGLGIGFGINYSPGATPAEIEQMFAVAASRDAPVFVHTRAFGLAAIEEAIGAAESTGVALHIVHIGSSSLDSLPQTLQAIDAARERGLDVTTEVYPYTAASTRLESAMFEPGWQKNLPLDYGDLMWVATGERLTKESFDRYRQEGGWIILFMMKDELISQAIAHPGVIIASDGVPFVDGLGHPRGAGTYARVLGHYVREQGVLSLMDALAKMTILPARRVEAIAPAMRRKGRVEVGADADLTVFDPNTVIDRATFETPTEPSAGIPHVLVGGTFVVRDGAFVEGATPGRPIRGGAETEEPVSE